MRQEKKQTAWLDIETKFKPWQMQTLSRLNRGIKKGEMFVVSAGRKTGKSMVTASLIEHYQKMIREEWREWEPVFIWPWNRKMSISKKKIWGRVMQKRNNVIGFTLYATKKEVFQRKLRGED